MKRRAFIKELTEQGCVLHRHGSNHDIYIRVTNGKRVAVPRHNEIKESLCKMIKRQLGIE